MTRRRNDNSDTLYLAPHTASERRKPKGKAARIGELAMARNCLSGDIVCLVHDGAPVFAQVAWVYGDSGDVQVRLCDRERRQIGLCADDLIPVPATTPVRFFLLGRTRDK